jgi:anaphase-promoting complex subunit 4
MDGLFRGSDPMDKNVVDVMVVGTSDGHIHLSIYDSFIVGLFPPPLPSTGAHNTKSQMILHAAHKGYSTHALLVESSSSSKPGLYFVPMDLRFVSASSEYLSLLASRSTALENLLRYMNQVQVLMTSEWQASQDLPRKFLRNVSESLEEKNGCDIVQAMYHSVATGHTFPAMRDWLVDELAERVSRVYKFPYEVNITYMIMKGHKRWDKAVTTGLENLRKMVHEHMLPALERCALILSRLAGVVKYQGSNNNIGFSSHQVNLVMDTLACLNLVSAKILTYVVEELDLFAAFSAWLRQEIDRLASDSSASPPDDILEKEATIDHSKVLLYIQNVMTTSRLSVFLQEDLVEEQDKYWASAERGSSLLERLDTQLQRQEEGLPYEKALPKIALLCRHMGRQAAAVFEKIAEAEKRNVLFGQPSILGNRAQNTPVAMKVYPQVRTLETLSAGKSPY